MKVVDVRFALRFVRRTIGLEVGAMIVATAVLAVLAEFAVRRLVELAPSASCLPHLYGSVTSAEDVACPTIADFVSTQSDLMTPVLLAVSLLPILSGALIGSQLIGREIDHGTAVLGWSIDPARRRWLIDRALSGLVIAGIIGIVCALVSSRLVAAGYPGIDTSQSFLAFGSWGPPLVVRAVAALAVGLVVGAAIGRMVPALVVSLFLSAALLVAIDLNAPSLMPTTLVNDSGGRRDITAVYVESKVRSADGRVLSFKEAVATAPTGLDAGDLSDWVYTHYVPVALVVPGDLAPTARLAAAIGALVVAVLGFAAAFGIVSRRRPY